MGRRSAVSDSRSDDPWPTGWWTVGSTSMDRPVNGTAGLTVGAVVSLHYGSGMSSPEFTGDLARIDEGNEDSTAELPVLIVDDAMPVAEIVSGRARVGWPNNPAPRLSHEATVPIAIPANLLGDAPAERPSLLVMVAVHGTFMAAAIALLAVLMVIAAK
jgi:hypothetical protein